MLTLLYRRLYLVIGWVAANATVPLLLAEAGFTGIAVLGWCVVLALPIYWVTLRPWLNVRLFLPLAARRHGWRYRSKPLRFVLRRRKVGDRWREYGTHGRYRGHRFGFYQEHRIQPSTSQDGSKTRETVTHLTMPLPEGRDGFHFFVRYHLWGYPKRTSLDELPDRAGERFTGLLSGRPGFSFDVRGGSVSLTQPGPIGLIRLRMQMRFLVRVMEALPSGTGQHPTG